MALLLAGSAYSQNGDLDATFDSDGKVSTEFGNYNSSINSLALQPDGKIIAAGATFNNGSYHRFALARYNTNGSIDTSFGTDGKVIGNHPTLKMSLCSILLQSDGKIIGGGIIYNNFSDSQFFLMRLNADGSVDTNYGTNGMIVSSNININAMALQADGKILAAGFIFNNSGNKDLALIRYNNDGTTDSGFGVNGLVTTSIGSRDIAKALALQPDGKIVVAATSTTSGYHSNFSLVRFFTNGEIDEAFGDDGVVSIDLDESDEPTSVKVQPDGRIVFTGWSGGSSSGSHAIIRLMEDGDFDESFGDEGIITGPGAEMAKSIELQSDGKMIVAGAYQGGGSNNIALTRLEADGQPDTTFGENGLITTAFSTTCEANAVITQADGKILIGGEAGTTGGTYSPDFALARYFSGLEQLGINDHDIKKNSFSVYPNPVNQTVNLQANLNNSDFISVDLLDLNGRKIQNLMSKKDFGSGYNSHELTLPDTLASGTYILNVSYGNNVSNIRIVK